MAISNKYYSEFAAFVFSSAKKTLCMSSGLLIGPPMGIAPLLYLLHDCSNLNRSSLMYIDKGQGIKVIHATGEMKSV